MIGSFLPALMECGGFGAGSSGVSGGCGEDVSEQLTDTPTVIWQDRFIRRELLPAGELARRFNILNPRSHPEAQREATESSLDTVGWIDEIGLSTNGPGPASLAGNPDAVMFDGHERVELALVRGGAGALVPVNWYQLSPEETDFALLVKDQTTEMAETKPNELKALLERTRMMTVDPRLGAMLAALKDRARINGYVSDFQPVGADTQPRLDQKSPITCPHCGIQFTPQ